MLLDCIRSSLRLVCEALTGRIVMSREVEETLADLLAERLPSEWAAVSYPSIEPLRVYLRGLRRRVAFFTDWATGGDDVGGGDVVSDDSGDKAPPQPPKRLWIAGFFFPQSLLTALRQNHARRRLTAVARIGFHFLPLSSKRQEDGKLVYGLHSPSGKEWQSEQELLKSRKGSAVVYGIRILCARWDEKNQTVCEARKGVPSEKLPPILLTPYEKEEDDDEGEGEMGEHYECPLYFTEERRGEILPSGHSSNLICHMRLACDRQSEFWLRRGVAAVMQRAGDQE